DQDALHERMEAGKCLLASVEARVAKRELSADLIREWGTLNRVCGALEIVYHARPDVGRLREGSQNLDSQRYWFSVYFLRIYKPGHRTDAVAEMEIFIHEIISNLPKG